MYEQETAAKVSKESVTERELNTLHVATGELLELVARLQEELAPVLASQAEKDGGLNGTPQESLSQVPQSIRRERENVQAAAMVLRQVLNRLEI